LSGGGRIPQGVSGQGISLEHQRGEGIRPPALAAQQSALAGGIIPLPRGQQQPCLPPSFRIRREPCQALQAAGGGLGIGGGKRSQQRSAGHQPSAAAQAGERQQQGEASQGQWRQVFGILETCESAPLVRLPSLPPYLSSLPGATQRLRALRVLAAAGLVLLLRPWWPLIWLPGWVVGLLLLWAVWELVRWIWWPRRWS
jgi:hypothetical protein